MTDLWIVLAGGSGAAARYVIDSASKLVARRDLPFGTFAINVTGSFLLALLVGAVLFHDADSQLRSIGGVGFCGGYTTFSAASLETVRLAQRRERLTAAAYAVGTLVACLGVAVLGIWLAGG